MVIADGPVASASALRRGSGSQDRQSPAIEVYDLEAKGRLVYRDQDFPGLMKGFAATGDRSFAFSSHSRLFHLTLREGGQAADRIEFVAPGPLNLLRVAHPNQGIVSLAASKARNRLLSVATSDDRKRFTLRAWELSSGKPLRLPPESRWKPTQVAERPCSHTHVASVRPLRPETLPG